MFTGIIEYTGIVKEIISTGTNKSFWVESPLATEVKVDQSISHSGVCLTVEDIKAGSHRVTAIDETLQKTNLGTWDIGTIINMERSLQMNGRLDGHMVQGHVDATGICTAVKEKDGSWEYSISYPEKFAALLIEKGSISLNGISLTAFNVRENSFTVAIIPFTYEHTNLKQLSVNGRVNLEFDMVGKYLQRHIELSRS
ncbi:MAG TPA: riboflavin synthase [Chitinophagaceae bacterium]|jgi:riboflavin synthase|nr:riboflavin synthase [Chitinophagaceae bacterium]HMU58721.1 riboflavin synthase [Chitinophagaceae bacterium]